MAICAVSVDLDTLEHYAAIHGVRHEVGAQDPVYGIALDRIRRFLASHALPATFFTVGKDLAQESRQERVRELCSSGFEIGNHSFSHPYDLARLEPSEMAEEVCKGQDAIARATGVTPSGFRAPGYAVSDTLIQILEDMGLRYDSSVFPAWPYYLAKAAILTAKRLSRRSSDARLDSPSVLAAPRRPYRMGKPYFRPGNGLVELPITTLPWLRLPFIGTALTMAGPRGARWMARAVSEEPYVNLELHAVDFLTQQDGLDWLAPFQPDLRVTLERKLASLSAAVETLRAHGHRFVALNEMARSLS